MHQTQSKAIHPWHPEMTENCRAPCTCCRYQFPAKTSRCHSDEIFAGKKHVFVHVQRSCGRGRKLGSGAAVVDAWPATSKLVTLERSRQEEAEKKRKNIFQTLKFFFFVSLGDLNSGSRRFRWSSQTDWLPVASVWKVGVCFGALPSPRLELQQAWTVKGAGQRE